MDNKELLNNVPNSGMPTGIQQIPIVEEQTPIEQPIVKELSNTNVNFNDVLNNHLISTEIFRSLVGAIGIVLSMPVSTFLAVRYLKK